MQMNYRYDGFNLHCFFMNYHTDYKFISIFDPSPITKITYMPYLHTYYLH